MAMRRLKLKLDVSVNETICDVFPLRFPSQSPLKSFPTRPPLKVSSDLPRLIRWDDYEEVPQRENVAPSRSSVLVRTNTSVMLRNLAALSQK